VSARSRTIDAAGVLLTHGAGGGADHPSLVALEAALEVPVRRMEFPYRRAGRRAPDRMPRLVEAIVSEATAFASELGVDTDRLVLGGRSMGGRACSVAVAEGLPAAGLVLLSYPLHPPGKPDKLRVDHFGAVTCPVLVVQGDKDPFGRPDELAAHLAALAGPTEVVWLAGAGHDPKRRDDEIVGAVQAWLSGTT
jgi:predicted alpha/beta-hydrolase family hydrolase